MIVCVNERLGTGQRSCVGSGSRDYIRKLRDMIATAGLDVAIVERECLGRCEEGPVMRIAPGGPFFTEIDQAVLQQIMLELKSFVAKQRL